MRERDRGEGEREMGEREMGERDIRGGRERLCCRKEIGNIFISILPRLMELK